MGSITPLVSTLCVVYIYTCCFYIKKKKLEIAASAAAAVIQQNILLLFYIFFPFHFYGSAVVRFLYDAQPSEGLATFLRVESRFFFFQ